MFRLDRLGRTFTIAVIGDSTGAADEGWTVDLGRWVSETFDRPLRVHPWSLDAEAYGPVEELADGVNAPVEIWNGSASGQGPAYSQEHLAEMLPAELPADLVFINHGHEVAANSIVDELEPLVETVALEHGNGTVVLVLQNPETVPDPRPDEHADNMADWWFWADSFGYPVVDVLAAFEAQPDYEALVDSTGVDPTSEGQQLWGETVIGFLQAAKAPKGVRSAR